VKDELADKILTHPRRSRGAVLEQQELGLVYRDGALFVRYYEETLPIAPDTSAPCSKDDRALAEGRARL
jgi:hypothetical protein